jgi:hypothetical protein
MRELAQLQEEALAELRDIRRHETSLDPVHIICGPQFDHGRHCVRYKGKWLKFGAKQWSTVIVLHEAALDEEPRLTPNEIMTRAGLEGRFRDLFKRRGCRPHPAWGTFVIVRPGGCELDLSRE